MLYALLGLAAITSFIAIRTYFPLFKFGASKGNGRQERRSKMTKMKGILLFLFTLQKEWRYKGNASIR